jgi:hypothetical protein
MVKIYRFNEYIKESEGGASAAAPAAAPASTSAAPVSSGGVAYSTLSNTGGMGNVVAPQPSSTPGDVAGSTKGSGDLPAYDMGNSFETPLSIKKKFKIKRRKKSNKKKK